MNKTIHTSKASLRGFRPLRNEGIEGRALEGARGALVLYLRRTCVKEKTCDGRLYADDGTHICDTAEATPYMLEPGEYTLDTKSSLIQKGNGVYALHTPAIYVGINLVPGVVNCSAQAYDRLYQRIKKARQRGHKIVLVVEQPNSMKP